MQYKCNECNDTGSTSKHMTGNLDCTSCETAIDRVMLESFIESLPAMGEQEQAWRIHQRALAMAPKQEAKEGSNKELRTLKEAAKRAGMANHFIDGKLRDDMFVIGKDFIERLHAELEKLCPPIAAPAAANGALTDDQINTIWESLPGLKIVAGRPIDHWNSLLRHEFARAILAAAGPDAALIKALESALAIINNEADPGEYAEPLKAIRAALSGAKGN